MYVGDVAMAVGRKSKDEGCVGVKDQADKCQDPFIELIKKARRAFMA